MACGSSVTIGAVLEVSPLPLERDSDLASLPLCDRGDCSRGAPMGDVSMLDPVCCERFFSIPSLARASFSCWAMACICSSSWSTGVGIDDGVDGVVLELGVAVVVVVVTVVEAADVVWDVSEDDIVVAVAVAVVVEDIAVPELACGPCFAWPYCV